MTPVKVAIIEDELSISELYKTKFEHEGFSVVTAANGSDGLKVIKKAEPAVVLLDLRMPGMSGDEMLAKLRATEWGASIRVIILTNLSRDEAPSSLRFLGVSRYVIKAHYTPSQVVQITREVLNLPH
ncbi:MAG: response regulator [Candidatus Saccharimonadales bacterium]